MQLQALQQMQLEPPDLALVDLVMPGLDGLGLIDRMRRSTALSGVQVVLITAADMTPATLHELNERAVTLVRKGDVDLTQLAHRTRELVHRVERSWAEDRA